MDEISVDFIQSCLDTLSGEVNKDLQSQLIKFGDKRNELEQWKLSAVQQVLNLNPSASAAKKIKKIGAASTKFKVGKSSLPNTGVLKGKRKLTFLNAYSNHLRQIQNDIPEKSSKSKEAVHQTRSLSAIFPNDAPVCSKTELLAMHMDLTLKCNKFLCTSSKNTLESVSRSKDVESLLESCGVQAKIFEERSLNGARFPSLRINTDIARDYPEVFPQNLKANDVSGNQCVPDNLMETNCKEALSQSDKDKTDLINSEINKTFEVVNDGVQTNEQIPLHYTTNIAKFQKVNQHFPGGNKTPVGKLILNGTNSGTFSTPVCSGKSNSGTPVIKKKNLTSYMQIKSLVSNVKGMTHPVVTNSGKSKETHTKQPVVATSKTVDKNTRPVRNLRTRPPPAETQPIAKKATKRTRVKDSPDVKNKRKQKEETTEQQKLDVQLKKEEKKQQREERMQKTKENRERLEQERRNKLQNSEQKKRQCVDKNKDLEPTKKTRGRPARQTTKPQNVKQAAPVLKVSKKARKSGQTNLKTKKLKKTTLVKENETETNTGASCSSASQQSSTFVLNKNSSTDSGIKHDANSTYTLKETAIEPKVITQEQGCVQPSSNINVSEQGTSSSCVSNATYVASNTPEEITKQKAPVTPFKIPNVTPKQNSKNTLKNVSRKLSSEIGYEMTPYRDDDDDDGDSFDDNESKKHIPSWASGIRLKEAIIKQACYPPDFDKLFGEISKRVNLEEIFGSQRHKIYKKRTSSAVWRNISFNLDI